MTAALRIEQQGGDVILAVKAVPGASRDTIAGVLADRLKVRVSTPPERGRADRAICSLLADALGVHAAQVSIEHGAGGARKSLRIRGMTIDDARQRLNGERATRNPAGP